MFYSFICTCLFWKVIACALNLNHSKICTIFKKVVQNVHRFVICCFVLGACEASRLIWMVQPFQWRSQNIKTFTHITGRRLDQAIILFNCVPFHYHGNFSLRKEFAPLNLTIFITHVRTCVMGATQMHLTSS